MKDFINWKIFPDYLISKFFNLDQLLLSEIFIMCNI